MAFLDDVKGLLERYRRKRQKESAKIVCLLDEIASLGNENESSLYSLLRGLAQQTPDLVFMVAGTPKACRIITEEASPFYNIFTPIHVGRLERDAAIALITRPVQGKISYTPSSIESLLSASRRHPYILQALCYHCVRLLPSSRTEVNTKIVLSAIKEWQLHNNWE